MQPGNLKAFFANLANLEKEIAANVVDDAPKKVGARPKGERAQTDLERQHKSREKCRAMKKRNIAILDMETDPFDAQLKESIKPFLAVLYSDEFETIVIWEENFDAFVFKTVQAIEQLPEKFTIYAHNGGKFDFLFLVSALRGKVQFKGRSLMSAKIGQHELRDSSHIIPERLAAFQKEKFDYDRNRKDQRQHWKKEIIEYCIADCRYTLDIVKRFIENYGLKLTIGQASMAELKKHYNVTKINAGFDAQLRQFYFGGRVECLAGRGHFKGDYKLYDVNSMYPAVMANRSHPIGGFENYSVRAGDPGPKTVFVELNCVNDNALIGRDRDGFTTGGLQRGKFKTTIWEFDVAMKYGLIRDVDILRVWDCDLRSDFSKFILPLYAARAETKEEMDRLAKLGMETTEEYLNLKAMSIFYKLLLNNSYGKFAMNPKNFKEHFLTDPGAMPDAEWFKSIYELEPEDQILYLRAIFENDKYAIWEKPSPSNRYNNVGTAASITGAARADLLEAIQHAKEPIYCDTDSIICRELSGVPLHKSELGAWDLEAKFSEVIVNGKKLYAVMHDKPKMLTPEQIADGRDPRYTVKSKGAAQITWDEMLAMLKGDNVVKFNRAPTLTKFGTQNYMQRTIRATAQQRI